MASFEYLYVNFMTVEDLVLVLNPNESVSSVN